MIAHRTLARAQHAIRLLVWQFKSGQERERLARWASVMERLRREELARFETEMRSQSRAPDRDAVTAIQARLKQSGVPLVGVVWRHDAHGGYFQIVVPDAAAAESALGAWSDNWNRLVISPISDFE